MFGIAKLSPLGLSVLLGLEGGVAIIVDDDSFELFSSVSVSSSGDFSSSVATYHRPHHWWMTLHPGGKIFIQGYNTLSSIDCLCLSFRHNKLFNTKFFNTNNITKSIIASIINTIVIFICRKSIPSLP